MTTDAGLEFLSINEAARLLDLSYSTVLKLIETGELHAVDVATKGSQRKHLRITDARDFLNRRSVKPVKGGAGKADGKRR